MAIYAVLSDTVSIQRYVFGSNKLKENLGASWLIQQIYEDPMQNAVKKVLPSTNEYDFDEWWKNPDVIHMSNGAEFEVGYIGGGKALLLFNQEKKAKEFIREWTRMLLVQSPGVVTVVACDEFDLSNFKTSNESLFRKLKENKYSIIPQTVIPRHGITAECSHSGYSMERWNDKEDKEEQSYVSSVTYAKLNASKEATDKLENDFKDILNDEYCFTNQLDKLGQSKGEDSHIAIVHIDGNGMGKRFRETESLEAIRKLSDSVEISTKESFKFLLQKIISQFSLIEDVLGFDTDEKKKKYPRCDKTNKKILPFRPIIIGGDDITFVSDGRLGIYFAKIFMEAFEKQKDKNRNELNLTSCAGIAITKTKYPFYRGYGLSEELCKNAKQVLRKKKEDNGSWFDFHISYGGFSGTLEEIRKSHYRVIQGDLLFRPYKIGDDPIWGFNTLIKNTKKLKEFPKSKIMEFRKVLTIGKESTQTFINELNARGLELPKINGKNYHINGFENSITPYFDMLELMEVYPSFELIDNKSGGATP